MLVSPVIYCAATSSEEGPGTFDWLKGILLLIISFFINNFVDKNEEDQEARPGESPLDEDIISNREILGFYVNWLTPYANSYDAMVSNHRYVDMVAPFWFTANPDGTIKSRYGGHQYEVDSFSKRQGLELLPLINNNQKNNMILVDSDVRSKTIKNIVKLVEKYNYNGVNIDFEFIPPWTRNGYTQFIKELSSELNKKNKKLTISVFPKIDVPMELQGAYDYAALGKLVDRVVIMTYDHHWPSGDPGPIAPINWVEKNIKYALEYIPNEKLLIGVANYGYDWPEGGPGRPISAKEAMNLAREKGVKVQWDTPSQSPYFYYQDNSGIKHEVWFESSSSLAFKLELVKKYNLKGIAIWRLGNGTDRFWEIIDNKLGQ
ncbi:chitinase [Halothermothrix orenii H 168]|uniref:Chitinase n=2 Tax=Halothermothrix orenii TaxID=31909 RepID=B8D0J1_HALOH|nr:chitinase [Halothermothrix orenii H 168]